MSSSELNPSWLDRGEYPFESNYFHSTVGKMHYVDEGEGEPVVFVHGNPDWSFSYRHQIKALLGTNRCIAPDHIGFGLSDKPNNWSYLPKDHAKNFADFMDHLDLREITLVVNDWGGPIGLSYALENPERIKNLVILNTWCWSVEKDWYYRGFSGFAGGPIGKFLSTNFNFFARVILKQAYAVKSRLTPGLHRQFLAPFPSKKDRKGTWVFPREIIGSSEWLAGLWSKFDCISDKRALILWGKKDIAFRDPQLDQWKKALHNFKSHTFSDAGHYPHEEKHEEVSSYLKEFLRNSSI